MFVRAKVLYIVGDNVGNSSSIDKTLDKLGIKSKFFNDNPNILSSIMYSNFLKKLPAETAFAVKKVSRSNNNNTHSFLIAIPFVSSHLGLPIKIGETIWLQEIDEVSDKEKFYEVNAYYLGRAHSYFTTEDPGYCYSDREDEIFNVSRKSFNQSRAEKGKNVKQKLNTLKESSIRSNSIFVHNTIGDGKEFNYLNKKNTYIKNSIGKYNIRPTTKFIKKPEDAIFQGTYNNMISLSYEKDNYDSNFRYGNIELIAGRGEYTKNEPPEEFEFDQVDANKNKIPSKVKIIKFNTDIAGSHLWNGIHYETIKTDMSFVNEGVINKFGLNQYDINFLSNEKIKAKSYNSNASCFNVSEYNIKSIEIQKNNKPSLRDITNLNEETSIESIVKGKASFSLSSPILYPSMTSSLLDSFYGGSSIAGVSDSIIFCTHKNIYSENNNIKLIQVNSDDNSPTQITLNPSGNILLDGNRILIGSFDRLSKKGHGKSAMVYLGHSKENQSLVLGERLNDFLEEILTVLVEVFRLIKEGITKLSETDDETYKMLNNLLTVLDMFTQTGSGMQGPIAPVGAAIMSLQQNLFNVNLSAVDKKNKEQKEFIENEILIKKNEEYSIRIQNIIENLELLLSKFTKTS